MSSSVHRLVVGLVALTGCDVIFRLDDVAGPPDAFVPRDAPGTCTTAQATFMATSCASVSFTTTPEEIVELAGALVGDPTLRGDGLEMFYTRPTSPYTIGFATRSTTTSPWQIVGDAPFDAPAANDGDPSISADGAYLAFVSDRGGAGFRPFLAHRACDTWDVVPMPGLESVGMTGLDLTWDALGLYYASVTNDVYQVHRSSVTEPFGSPTLVASAAPFPSISSDELELYFNSGGVYRATRTSLGQAFGQGTVVIDMAADGDVSVDGATLVSGFSTTHVQISRRTCP